MQDDTFKIIATYVWQASESLKLKDIHLLESNMDAVLSYVHPRIPPTIVDEFERIRSSLYGDKYDDMDGRDVSVLFDELRRCYWEMTGALDKQGLLFRARVDPGEMITK